MNLTEIKENELTVATGNFTPQELQRIDSLKQALSPSSIRNFGHDVLENSGKPADKLLNQVKSLELGDDVSLSNVVTEMELMDKQALAPQKQNFFMKLIGRAKHDLLDTKNKYQSIAAQTNNIAGVLETQKDQLAKNNDVIAELAETITQTTEELQLYVAAAELELNDVLKNQIPELKKLENDPRAQQKLFDLQDYAMTLDTRIHNFKQAIAASLTQRENLNLTKGLVNQKMSDLNETLLITVPIIKSSLASTIATLQLEKAVAVDELTRNLASELIVSNTKKLQMITSKMDEQRAKGVIDYNMLGESRRVMVDIINEHFAKTAEIQKQRKEAEVIMEEMTTKKLELLDKLPVIDGEVDENA